MISSEEASVFLEGTRGMPYPGQKPLSELEAHSQKVQSADGKVDEATAAALDAAAAREAAEKEANKGCECFFSLAFLHVNTNPFHHLLHKIQHPQCCCRASKASTLLDASHDSAFAQKPFRWKGGGKEREWCRSKHSH